MPFGTIDLQTNKIKPYSSPKVGRVSKCPKKRFFNTLPEKTETQIKDMNDYLGINLKRTTQMYDKFDAIDSKNKKLLECKHRSVKHNNYNSTIIGLNKYLLFREKYTDWDFYASFLFTDGLYYYKFDNTKTLEEQGLFTSNKQYNTKITNGFVKEHINIPIKKLIRIADGEEEGDLETTGCLIILDGSEGI